MNWVRNSKGQIDEDKKANGAVADESNPAVVETPAEAKERRSLQHLRQVCVAYTKEIAKDKPTWKPADVLQCCNYLYNFMVTDGYEPEKTGSADKRDAQKVLPLPA